MDHTQTNEGNKPQQAKKQNALYAFVAFLLTKGTVFLKALKALKYVKFAITAVTMSISALLYGFTFGSWYFGVGLVLLLLVHEYGHVIAMWIKGVKASAPVFIPFLGAAIFAKLPEKKTDEAFIGFGGPLVGTIGALVCIAVALVLPAGTFWSTLLHILGNVGLFINLFNLIPARPLDGGRILHPLGNWVAYIGFACLVFMALVLKDTFFLIIAMLTLENLSVRSWVRSFLWGCVWLGICAEWYYTVSKQSLLLTIIATMLIVCSTLCFYFAWCKRYIPLPLKDDEPESLPIIVKLKWFTYYIALGALLGGTMMWHSRHLPKEVHDSSLSKIMHEL